MSKLVIISRKSKKMMRRVKWNIDGPVVALFQNTKLLTLLKSFEWSFTSIHLHFNITWLLVNSPPSSKSPSVGSVVHCETPQIKPPSLNHKTTALNLFREFNILFKIVFMLFLASSSLSENVLQIGSE